MTQDSTELGEGVDVVAVELSSVCSHFVNWCGRDYTLAD